MLSFALKNNHGSAGKKNDCSFIHSQWHPEVFFPWICCCGCCYLCASRREVFFTFICVLLCEQTCVSLQTIWKLSEGEVRNTARFVVKPNYSLSLSCSSALFSLCVFVCVCVCVRICVGKAKVWITSSQLSGSGSEEGGRKRGRKTIRMTDKDKGKKEILCIKEKRRRVNKKGIG